LLEEVFSPSLTFLNVANAVGFYPTKPYLSGLKTHAILYRDYNLSIWINGKITCSKHREHNLYFDSKEEPVIIGNILHGGEGKNNHLNGSLDELRIYNRSLKKEEIQILNRH